MPELFGLDIAGIVDGAMQQAGGVKAGVLVKSTPGTRTSGQLTGGTNPTTTSYPFRGFLEQRSEVRREGTIVRSGGQFMSIFGASLPAGLEPTSGDLATLENTQYSVVRLVSRDPASALYVVEVEE